MKEEDTDSIEFAAVVNPELVCFASCLFGTNTNRDHYSVM